MNSKLTTEGKIILIIIIIINISLSPSSGKIIHIRGQNKLNTSLVVSSNYLITNTSKQTAPGRF